MHISPPIDLKFTILQKRLKNGEKNINQEVGQQFFNFSRLPSSSRCLSDRATNINLSKYKSQLKVEKVGSTAGSRSWRPSSRILDTRNKKQDNQIRDKELETKLEKLENQFRDKELDTQLKESSQKAQGARQLLDT